VENGGQGGEELVEERRRAVARVGLGSGGEEGGPDPAAVREGGVAGGVYAPVDRDQAAPLEPPVDLVAGQVCGHELASRDHTVLATGEPRDHLVGSANVARHLFTRPRHDVCRK
jgi:hypothetical protein